MTGECERESVRMCRNTAYVCAYAGKQGLEKSEIQPLYQRPPRSPSDVQHQLISFTQSSKDTELIERCQKVYNGIIFFLQKSNKKVNQSQNGVTNMQKAISIIVTKVHKSLG